MDVNKIVVSLIGINRHKRIDDEYLEDLLVQDLEGGSIINIHWISDDKAIVTLKSQDAAKALIRKGIITTDDGRIEIRKHDVHLTNDVLVGNLPEGYNENKLKLSLRKLGLNGKIVTIRPLCGTSAVVTFENTEVAAKVAESKILRLGTAALSTQLYIPEIEEAIVYIEGVPTDLTEELLEEVLREILYEGVIITEIQMISKSRAAMVKFEKLADSKKLLQLKFSKMEHYDLNLHFSAKAPSTLSPRPQEGKTKILMSSLPIHIDGEHIEMFFQNEKYWTGGNVLDVDYFQDKNQAMVTFEESSDAKNLVEKGTLDVKGAVVEIEWYGVKPDKARTINVSNLPPGMDNDMIRLYFESSRLKGGPVDHVEHSEESRAANVCFRDAEVAQRMADNGTMVWREKQMTIKMCESEDEDDASVDRRIMVYGVPQTADEDLTKIFFENSKNGGPVEKVYFNESGQIVITFKERSVAETMVRKGKIKMGKSILCLKWCKADESVDKRKVVVSDLPSGVSKDSIQLYFESKNNNGGPVEEVEYEIGDETALVTFQESEDAKTIVAKHEMEMKRKLVKVTWYKEKPRHGATRCTEKRTKDSSAEILLEVTNIPQNCAKEHVKLKLLSSVAEKEESIEDMRYNVSAGRAIVRFTNETLANKVWENHQKEPLFLQDQKLEIKLIDSQSLEGHAQYASSCALRITNLPECKKKEEIQEDLELVFDNSQNTGNEGMEGLYISKDMTMAVVTYKNPEGAEYVMCRHMQKPFEIDGQKVHIEIIPALDVHPNVEQVCEENILFVKGLPTDITSEDIHRFLEPFCGRNVCNIVCSHDMSSALIQFHHPPDFEQLFEKFCLKPLEGKMVTPSRVEQSRIIEVYGVCKPKNICKEKVGLYFESRKSGGGKVETVTIHSDEDCALVEFKNVQDAVNVLKQPTHTLEQQTLKVKLHHKCIGLQSDTIPRLTDTTVKVSDQQSKP